MTLAFKSVPLHKVYGFRLNFFFIRIKYLNRELIVIFRKYILGDRRWRQLEVGEWCPGAMIIILSLIIKVGCRHWLRMDFILDFK